MNRTAIRFRSVLVLFALAMVAFALFPLLRANAAARQRAWEDGCVADGGAISTRPPEQRNPLVTQTGHTVYECLAADGHVVSVRD